jgi:hypothetical protein
MDIREAHLIEIDILNTIWWLWCNQKINLGDVKYFTQDLDLQIEFITLDGYKFTNKDKTITYSYDRQQKESTQ